MLIESPLSNKTVEAFLIFLESKQLRIYQYMGYDELRGVYGSERVRGRM